MYSSNLRKGYSNNIFLSGGKFIVDMSQKSPQKTCKYVLNVINTRAEVEVDSHSFLIAGLDGSKRPISHSGHSTHGGSGSRNSKVHVLLENNFGPALGKEKIFYRSWKSNYGFFFVERAVYTHTDRVIPAPLY